MHTKIHEHISACAVEQDKTSVGERKTLSHRLMSASFANCVWCSMLSNVCC